MNGRSRRRRRSSPPNAGASSATASRLKKPATSNAPIASVPSPWNGSRATGSRRRRSARRTRAIATLRATASAAAATSRTRPSSDVKRKPPWNRLDGTVDPELQRRSRAPGHGAPPGDPGRRTDTRRERNRQMATETARTEESPPDVTEHLDHRGPRGSAARDAHDARHRRARDDALPPGQGPRQLLRRVRPGGRLRRGDLGDVGRRTACASCTATSRPTSSAASSRGGSSPSTWAARTASRAAATATCTSATAPRAASAWSRCSPT